MCGRYCIAAVPGELKDRYLVDILPDYRPGYNISPSQEILTLALKSERPRAIMAKWGFHTRAGNLIINARIENIYEKPLFKSLIHEHRCIIPASGYFEWKKTHAKKIPYYITVHRESIISFAGLIRETPQGYQVVILTKPAHDTLASIHQRMPVILNKKDEQIYLSKGEITHIPGKIWKIVEVSPLVNNISSEGPNLIRPMQSSGTQKSLSESL